MFEQTFKNIDDLLRKEAGCASELDYTEQTSWLLFLKYLDDLEEDKAAEAIFEGREYRYILDEKYRWDTWAAPKNAFGMIDLNVAKTGDDLRDFVRDDLFPYLKGFKQRHSDRQTIEYKIGEIFGIFWKCFHALASSIDHLLKRARYAGPALSIRCITVFILSGEFLKKP